jgi:hypothetical protein
MKWPILVSKNSSLGTDSKNINLPWGQNAPKKSYFKKRKILGLSSLCEEENLFFEITFLGAFCH